MVQVTVKQERVAVAGTPPVGVATERWYDGRLAGRWIVAGLAVVATFACLFRIQNPWPWSDEGATYLALQRSWTELAVLWQGADAPMVPYYYLAKAWTGVMSLLWPTLPTVTAARTLSAAAAVLTVLALYAIVARHAGRLTGVLAALVLLTLPGFIRYAQEARPYALLALAATVAWLASDRRLHPGRVARGLDSVDGAAARGNAAGTGFGPAATHAVSLAAVGAIHTFGLAQWPAHLLAWAAARGDLRTRLRRIGSIAIVLLAAALLVSAQVASTFVHGTGPNGARSARMVTSPYFFEQLYSGISITPDPLASATVLVLALVGVLSRPGGRRTLPLNLAIWLVVPLALSVAVGAARTNLFRLRYWVAFLPPLAALAAVGIVSVAVVVVRLLTGVTARALAAPAATGRRGAATAVLLGTVLALLALQAAVALPAQRQIRSPDGHDVELSGVLAALDAARLRDPGLVPVIANGTVHGMLSAVEPALLTENPFRQLDPALPTVYTVPVPAATVHRNLSGDRRLLWIYRGELSHAQASADLPGVLSALHPVVLRVDPAGPGWTVVLLQTTS